MARTGAMGLAIVGMLLLSGCGKIAAETKAVDASVDAILKAIAAGEIDRVYDDYTTAGLRQATSREAWQDFVSQFFPEDLGALKGWKRSGFNLQTRNGITTAEMTYQVTWEHGQRDIDVLMLKQGGDWKLQEMSVR